MGLTQSWNEQGKLEYSVDYDNDMIKPVVRYKGPPGPATLQLYDGSVTYFAPKNLILSIRKGMTARKVSQILKLDVSPKMGVKFTNWSRNADFQVTFKNGKVFKLHRIPNGFHHDIHMDF